MATALPLLGVQYPSAIRYSRLPRVRRVACIPKGATALTGFSTLDTYALCLAKPGMAEPGMQVSRARFARRAAYLALHPAA